LGEGGALNGSHFLIGLAVHKVPVSLALAALLVHSGIGRSKALLVLGGFSLVAPLGILLGYGIPAIMEKLPPDFSHYLFALVLGIVLHVSTTILFESSEEHRFEGVKLLVILAGFALAIFF
jgi:zinc transporter ZupT